MASVLALALSACGAAKSGEDGNAQSASGSAAKYTFGTDATYPPFEFQKDGKYVGIDIDLMNAIAAEEGFEVEIKPMDFKGIIPAITANQLDGAIASISITDERKKVVDFSDPYYQAGLSLIVNEDNNDIKSPQDLKAKSLRLKRNVRCQPR